MLVGHSVSPDRLNPQESLTVSLGILLYVMRLTSTVLTEPELCIVGDSSGFGRPAARPAIRPGLCTIGLPRGDGGAARAAARAALASAAATACGPGRTPGKSVSGVVSTVAAGAH